MNSRKPTLTSPITPSTLATIASGTLRLNTPTSAVQTESVRAHSNSEPSCPPQTPETR